MIAGTKLAKLILKGRDMKKMVALLAMIAGVSFGGIPIQRDVKVGYDGRFNDSSTVAYNITAKPYLWMQAPPP